MPCLQGTGSINWIQTAVLDLSAISVLATGIFLVLNLEDSFFPQKEEGSGLSELYVSLL